MKKEDIKAPFPREPWKRLLEDSSDAPPETTDARIRASARKAVTPHAARWWVHAGLAASFVVAVVIAQALFGGGGRDPAGESRVVIDLLNRPNAISPPPPPEAAAAAVRKEAPRAAGQAPAIETDDYDESAAGELAEIQVDDSRIGGPERERRAASEAPEESFMTEPPAEESRELSNVVVTGSRADAAPEESADSQAQGAAAFGILATNARGLVCPDRCAQEGRQQRGSRRGAQALRGCLARLDEAARQAEALSPRRYLPWLVLALVSLANFGNFYVYDSIGPVADLLERQRGFSNTQIGLLNAIYNLPNIVLLLVGGMLVDRFGAARMLTWTAAICFAGALLTAYAPAFASMASGRLLFGIGAETFNIATIGAVVRYFPHRHLALAIGLSMALGRGGAFSVDMSPTWFAGAYAAGWQPPLEIAAFFAGTSLAASATLLVGRPSRRHEGQGGQTRRHVFRCAKPGSSVRRTGTCSCSACCGTR